VGYFDGATTGAGGSGYFSSSSGGGYFGGGGLAAAGGGGGQVKHGGHSLVHNLITDVVDTAKGFGPGVAALVEHPVGTLENIGRSYADMYGPLFHGDVGGFMHNLHEHPLGPILDAVTILTLGAGASP
jgi:hypothetical protein